MSTLLLNTLTGKTSAGSIVVTGEGGSTTTNMQQGLAKAWAMNENTSSAFTTHDSFNISGETDEANGQTTFAINNDMGNANYSIVTGGGTSSSQRDRTVVVRYDVTATGSCRLDAYDQSSSDVIGMNALYNAIFGDLA
tara:strand:- start:517 stop:930 length:414 start_codon:yes stop_codon:yes gene_type:complete